MNTEALRAEFEAWYAQRGLGWCREEDACLAAYQACAAARTEEVRAVREALDGMLAAHPHANDGRVGWHVLVTEDAAEACRAARAALEQTK